jgi:hypothetical protein
MMIKHSKSRNGIRYLDYPGRGPSRALQSAGLPGQCLRVMSVLAALGAMGAHAGEADVCFQQNGIGVDGGNVVPTQINADGTDASRGSEALLIDLGAEYDGVEVTVSNLLKNESGCVERGRWSAFDERGFTIGSGVLSGPTADPEDEDNTVDYGGHSSVGTAALADGARFLVFDALPYGEVSGGSCDRDNDSSDYYVRAISTRSGEGPFFGGVEENRNNNSCEPFEVSGEQGPSIWAGDEENPGLLAESFAGYAFGTAFTDGSGRLLGPSGNLLVDIVFNIQPDDCDGNPDAGSGSAETCNIELDGRLTTTFENAADISGELQLVALESVSDPREACAPGGDPAMREELYLDAELSPTDSIEAAVAIIPSYLCGIPDGISGGPRFTAIDLESTLRVTESFILHTVDNEPIAPFACRDPGTIAADSDPDQLRSQQPVIAWLPRGDEIPVIGPDGEISRTVEDITTGCGSTRGKSTRLSYLFYDLRHLPGTNYVAVIRSEYEQLLASYEQLAACVQNGTLTSTINSSVRKSARWFDQGRYERARRELLELRAEAEDFESRIGRDLPSCFWAFDDGSQTGQVVESSLDIEGNPFEPLNARGSLLTQIDHIVYMIETMLGVFEPAPEQGPEPASAGVTLAEDSAADKGPGKGNAKGKKKGA